MAKGAVENALWDAEAQARQIPLWKLLGGTQKGNSPAAFRLEFKTLTSSFWKKLIPNVKAGYRRIKVKCKPGWDVEVFEKIRARWPGNRSEL